MAHQKDENDLSLRWVDRMREGTGDRAAFHDWLVASPKHVESALRSALLQEELSRITEEQWEEINRLATHAAQPDEIPANVFQLDPAGERAAGVRSLAWRRFRRPVWLSTMAAAVIAIACIGAWLAGNLTLTDEYQTALGEQRAIALPDRSVMRLNTQSHVEVRYSAGAREIWLERGEAMFSVAHDMARPFQVHVAGSTVRAVGTQFNVRRREEGGAQVAVLEGRVAVIGENSRVAGALTSNALVFAGEQVTVSRSGRLSQRRPADAARVAAWQERRLVFDKDLLSDVVAEFNRYGGPILRVEGDVASKYRYSGIFAADDPRSLIQALARDPDLEIEHVGGQVVIRARSQVGRRESDGGNAR